MNVTEDWNQELDRGDIFHEDFRSEKLTRWKDMKAWGFGVWQIKDGKLMSIDPDEPEKTIVAILPDFQTAVVNRDFSVLFHFKPILKKDFLFIIDFRNQGVNNYRLEIDKEGRLSIVKNLVAHWPRKLFETAVEKVRFDQWQWLRLDVRGENPVHIGAKIWQGEKSDEPEFYTAFASDLPGLTPENLNFALTVMQSGGSRVEIDHFNIFSKIPPQKIWQWHFGIAENEKIVCKNGFHFFQKGELLRAQQAMREIHEPVAQLNNLAIIEAERGKWSEAKKLIHRARKNSPKDATVIKNYNWIWYAQARGGLLEPDVASFGFVTIDKKVFLTPEKTMLKIVANRAFQSGINDDIQLKIEVFDDKNNCIRSFVHEPQFDEFGELKAADTLDVGALDNGEYWISARIISKGKQFPLSKIKFESHWQEFGKSLERRNRVDRWLKLQKSNELNPADKNDLANVAVQLIKLNQQLSDCETPGNFSLYKEKIEEALSETEKLMAEISAGKNPFRHKKGTFLRGYYSEIDGSVQGYALFVPENYNQDTPYPLVVNLHGYDPSFSSWQENIFLPIFMPHTTKGGRYIVVNPFGRGNTMYQNLGEQDVLAVIAEVKRLYSVDENRVYLTGGSMGGGGTWHIGLTHPDMFAALAPIMGPTEFSFWIDFPYQLAPEFRKFLIEQRSPLFYAENALHLPIYCNHGVLDDIVPIEQSRKIVKRLQKLGYNISYVEHPEAAHGGFDPKMDEAIYDWFENLQQEPRPEKVVLKAGDLNHTSAYWVEILRFVDILKFAEIEARAKNSTFEINTKNVTQFKIKLNLCPTEISQKSTFRIDGQEIRVDSEFLKNEIAFFREQGNSEERSNWKIYRNEAENKLVKRKGLTGPFVDVFNDGFVLVYGTNGSRHENRVNFAEAEAFREQWQQWQHVSCRVKSDREISETFWEKFNLILFGSPRANLITQKIANLLPVRFGENEIQLGDRSFKGQDVGISLIYPNPLNPNRYVALLAGTSWRAIQGCTRRIGMDFDYQIYDSRTLGIHVLQGNLTVDGTPLLCGFFDQDWQIDSAYQWSADEMLREKIAPKKFVLDFPENRDKIIFLSDLKPDSIYFWTGESERDRSFWSRSFQIENKKFEKGLGLFPPVTLTFQLNGSYEKFSAIFAAEMNPYWNFDAKQHSCGKMQLAVYGDGEELYVSPAIDINSAPVSVKVPILGVKKFVLKIRTQDWLPKFAQAASLIDAKLIRNSGDK